MRHRAGQRRLTVGLRYNLESGYRKEAPREPLQGHPRHYTEHQCDIDEDIRAGGSSSLWHKPTMPPRPGVPADDTITIEELYRCLKLTPARLTSRVSVEPHAGQAGRREVHPAVQPDKRCRRIDEVISLARNVASKDRGTELITPAKSNWQCSQRNYPEMRQQSLGRYIEVEIK